MERADRLACLIHHPNHPAIRKAGERRGEPSGGATPPSSANTVEEPVMISCRPVRFPSSSATQIHDSRISSRIKKQDVRRQRRYVQLSTLFRLRARSRDSSRSPRSDRANQAVISLLPVSIRHAASTPAAWDYHSLALGFGSVQSISLGLLLILLPRLRAASTLVAGMSG